MTTLLSGLLAAATLSSSCAAVDAAAPDVQAKGRKAPAKATMNSGPTPPTTNFVTMRDPVEDMFSIGMPKGWSNRVYSVRVFDVNTMVATAISPDGSVVIFAGDPSMPQYWSPGNPSAQQMAQFNKMMRIEPFVSAERYFPAYAKRKFGKLPGFKIVSSGTDEEEQEKLQRKFSERGMNVRATVAKVDFNFQDGGRVLHARIMGATCDSGPFWGATVSGIATTGDPDRYTPMAEAMSNTHKMNPAWQARQQERHQQAMAEIQRKTQQMTDRHNANMAWIQDSAQRHQQRMQSIWSANDAHNQAFERRMNSMDTTQRSFLNYINDENTVVSPSGKTYQVDNSYQRYFVHKTNRTYVGGDIRMDIDHLRQLGLNPDDYEEVKIRP